MSLKNDMQTSNATGCYDGPYLERFLGEGLDESEELRVQEHLEGCEACQARLEDVAGEPDVWTGVRVHLNDEAPLAAPADVHVDELAELMSLLDPTDDPRMLGRIGVYEVLGLIGRGATGMVMKAFESRLNRYVAIKLLSPVYRSNGSARRRFEREGRAVAAVSDEHVVPIYAVDDHRGLPYIVMQYIPGLSLEQRIERDGPLDTCEVVRVGLQVAKGLAAAHAQGIVHRDVKPANVILEDTVERAMVTDFGLARVVDEASMTSSGTISGTPHYMSPEQARGDMVDPRSDLFSLGSLLYAAATGRPPFRAENVYGVINRVTEQQPRPIREVSPTIEPWLVALVERLMAKRPENRFQSSIEVVEALTPELAHLQSPAVAAVPPRDWLPASAVGGDVPRPRWRSAALLAGGLGLVAVGAFGANEFRSDGGLRGSLFAGLLGFAEEDSGEGLSVREIDTDEGRLVEVEQVTSRDLDVGDSTVLFIDSSWGDVELVPTEEEDVRVEMTRRVAAPTLEAAKAGLFEFDYEMTSEQDGLRLVANCTGDEAAEGPGYEEYSLRVELPVAMSVEVKTKDGHVSLSELEENVRVETKSGNICASGLLGDLNAVAEGGSIQIDGIEGAGDVLAIGGCVRVTNSSKSMRVRTSLGNVYLGSNDGEVYAQTSGGDIHVHEVSGPVSAHTEHGDLFARFFEGPAESSMFTASDGDVHVALAEPVAVTLAVQGTLKSEIEFQPEPSRDGVMFELARVNGGGRTLELVSASGSVEITRFDPEHPANASSLGGSGLGGSGSPEEQRIAELSEVALAKTTGPPRPGALATIEFEKPVGQMDGYTLYLPVSHDVYPGTYPVLVYLQGGYGVGGEVADVNRWGLARLLRDEHDLSSERNRLLLDSFIVVCPHIQDGDYDDEPELVASILDDVLSTYKGDPDRVHVTGLSRGGHGSWGLAVELPGRFASVAPIGANSSALDRDGAPDLAGVSIWIAHNRHDGVVPFSESDEAIKRLEARHNVEFLELAPNEVAESDYMEHSYVLTSSPSGSHDAWTDLYSNPEFYRWMLAQRGAPRQEGR